MTPEEYYAYGFDDTIKHSKEFVESLPKEKFYIGAEHFGFYGEEDVLDQVICLAAAKQGIDIIILTHMPGAYQVVGEVLDCRERTVSFANLIFNS